MKTANEFKIPLEFNCCSFIHGEVDLEKEKTMLDIADQIYINSDAHNLREVKYARQEGIKWLKEIGIWN